MSNNPAMYAGSGAWEMLTPRCGLYFMRVPDFHWPDQVLYSASMSVSAQLSYSGIILTSLTEGILHTPSMRSQRIAMSTIRPNAAR
jgi:hypothetical protein